MNKRIDPPYKPMITDDLKYFDQRLVNKDEFLESVIDTNNMKLIQKN